MGVVGEAPERRHPTSIQHLGVASASVASLPPLRTAPGMRERAPGVWELIVEGGSDPVTGKRRQVSRVFRGNLREAKKARAELLVEVGKGRHTGTGATVDELFDDWLVELRRKGRSPNTIRRYEQVYRHNIQARLGSRPVRTITTKMLTDLYGAHQDRGLAPRSVYQIHACLSSMFTQGCKWGWRDTNPAPWADPPAIPNTTPVVPDPEQVQRLIEAATRGPQGRALCPPPPSRPRLEARRDDGDVEHPRAPPRAAPGDPDEEPPGPACCPRRGDAGCAPPAGRVHGGASDPGRRLTWRAAEFGWVGCVGGRVEDRVRPELRFRYGACAGR